MRVFDPFSGTGTTALSAAYHGHNATTVDINPFLVWLGKAKTDHYSQPVIENTRKMCSIILHLVNEDGETPPAPPPLYNIERWWSPASLSFLSRLQKAINKTLDAKSQEATLLKVAFCRTLIACSNATFNHQSMSFKDATNTEPLWNYGAMFDNDVEFVLQGAGENPDGHVEVSLHDARCLSSFKGGVFDLVITSPPYANRMSYIRELRPYMYWLGFLINGRDAGELDWEAIGGTWGIATSRLNTWDPGEDAYTSLELDKVLGKVANPNNANGELLSKYIRKYCVDMAIHFKELRTILAPCAELHYIVGNSTFYGELLSVEQIYADIMQNLGYENVQIRAIRKRNSKKELIEFDVSARWQTATKANE